MKTFTQAEVERIVAERVARECEKYKDFEHIKAKLAEYQAGGLAQKAAESRVLELESCLAEAEGRIKAAAVRELKRAHLIKRGLPIVLAERINGEDEKTIEADVNAIGRLLKNEILP